MKIPVGRDNRQAFYQDLIIRCFASRPARIALYDTRKNYYLWGNAETAKPVDYNKLFAHIDLLASFLFSGETTSFVIEIDDGIDDGDPQLQMKMASKLVPALNKRWHRSNEDLVFNEALVWALVYDTMFIKKVPRPGGGSDTYAVEPHALGVLLEHEPMLDKQPCIVHEFFITKSDLEVRIRALPAEEQAAILALCGPFDGSPSASAAVPASGTDKLILAATADSLQGSVQNVNAWSYDFEPEVNEDGVIAQEVWVWDTDKGDYNMALMLRGEYLLIDCEKNPFVPQEQPFVKLCPNQLYNYFWGRSELMYLIPIQEWVNERIPEIKRHLQKQTNPPRSASGFQGYTEDKFAVLDTPGGTIFEPQIGAQAKLDLHMPAPINVFDVLDRCEMMFAEVSGIRELMQGRGESGVRAMSHANLLVRVGSSRVKKKAAMLEDAVEKIGDLNLKIMQKYDDTHYKTDEGMLFIAAQLSKSAIVKVDSHSSSPIFVEQQIDKAQLLFEAGAIDREDLIDAVKPQNPGVIKKKLIEREKVAAENARIAAERGEANETANK